MTYAEKRLIKERALKKNFEERLEKARYECFKEKRYKRKADFMRI